MWHELSVVYHSRQAAQVTMGWREFAREQLGAEQELGRVWEALGERLAGMPME
jgi:sorting nexin-8